MKIVVATKNNGKLREIKKLIERDDIELFSMSDMGIDVDVVEDGTTFEENALKKAREISKLCGEITIADDSGLCVDALSGAPGIYSARYSGEDATDLKNNLKLLDAMKDIKDRNAKFVCALALVFPDGREKVFYGEFHGVIDHEMKGTGGFGYDVLFYLPEYQKTSAEIPAEEKNRISHRAKAFEQLNSFLG